MPEWDQTLSALTLYVRMLIHTLLCLLCETGILLRRPVPDLRVAILCTVVLVSLSGLLLFRL
jgi:hypothetical protein